MNYANKELKKGSEAVQWYITAGEWNEPADERFFSRIGLGEVEPLIWGLESPQVHFAHQRLRIVKRFHRPEYILIESDVLTYYIVWNTPKFYIMEYNTIIRI